VSNSDQPVADLVIENKILRVEEDIEYSERLYVVVVVDDKPKLKCIFN